MKNLLLFAEHHVPVFYKRSDGTGFEFCASLNDKRLECADCKMQFKCLKTPKGNLFNVVSDDDRQAFIRDHPEYFV